MKFKDVCSLEEKLWSTRQHIKSRGITCQQSPTSQSNVFSSSHVWMWQLEYKKSWEPKNWCFWTLVLEKTLDNPLGCKEIQSVHPKEDQSWVFIGRTDVEAETPIFAAIWCKELTHWKRPWCWDRLKVGGEGDNRGWDGWMASLPQWTWVCVSSGSWWWTGRPGMLHSMGLKRVRHDWASEIYWTEGDLKNDILLWEMPEKK